ncbi:GDSL esterase/lipase At1g71250-like [Punica granatum]|uniref:GDSL esterase/lipase At1g71250-like n=1 Tax=Punica granatum TaxID=22663 RepID=A0A6P8EAR2_PUNGR|nr:GDSL esterase/lipase At1g71250-like [Punica granatum]XP_031402363.1 GDSL esterase/lipase At1g71250-like [Punica granatum]
MQPKPSHGPELAKLVEKRSQKMDDQEWGKAATVLKLSIIIACLWMVVGAAGWEDGYLSTISSEKKGLNVSAFYVLGDSSVDCGDNTLFYPFLHHNLSLLPCDGADQSLVPHFLAQKMGFPFTPPFYGQNGSVDGLLRGLNFGSAQATIMSTTGHEFQSLNQQLRQVLETFQLLQLHLTPQLARSYIESSVIYLSFGKDDYVDLFLHNSSGIMHKFTGPEFARILVDQMAAALKTLHASGARKIICVGILPLGCTPRTVWEWNNSWGKIGGSENNGTVCINEINELVSLYNILLEERIVSLNSDLPGSEMVFCDVYEGIMEIVNNPKQHGFDDVRTACCGLGVTGSNIGCLSMEMACKDKSTHLWWDLYNPTQAANRLLGESAWSGLSLANICRPTTIHHLVSP